MRICSVDLRSTMPVRHIRRKIFAIAWRDCRHRGDRLVCRILLLLRIAIRTVEVSLEAYAAQAMSSDSAKPLPALPSRSGSFKASSVERLPHGFLFFCDYGHPLDANGIAYSLEPLPQVVNGRDTFTHIDGNWYVIWRN